MIAGAFTGALLTDWRPDMTWIAAGGVALISAALGAATPAGSSDRVSGLHLSSTGISADLRKPVVMLLLASGAAFGIEAGIRNIIYQPYVIELSSGSVIYLAYFQAALAVARIAGILVYRRWLIRMNRGPTFVLVALLIFAFAEFVAYFATGWMEFLPLYVAGVFALGWYFPLKASLFNEEIAESRRATMISISGMCESAASGLACVAMAFAIDSAPVRAWWLAGAVALVASSGLFFLAMRALLLSRKAPAQRLARQTATAT